MSDNIYADKLREADIRPDNLNEQIKDIYSADLNWLVGHKDRFINVDCPACNCQKWEVALLKDGLQYVRCLECATVYTNPRPSLELLDQFYTQSKGYEFWNNYTFPASEEGRRIKLIQPRVNKIKQLCQKYSIKTNVLVEVGPGFGTFAEESMRAGIFKNVIAIEANPSLADSCRKKGIEVLNGLVENVQLKEKADVLASFEVIEHIFSPRKFIEDSARILNTSGLLILTCPNVFGFDNLALWKNSSTFDHEHLNYFNPKSLSRLIASCGFKILETSTPGKLDVELVRKALLRGEVNMDENRFLKHILLDRWDDLGDKFQEFLSENHLSGHMWVVAQKE